MDEQSRAIGERDQPKREKFVPPNAFMMFTSEINDTLANERSEHRSDRQPCTDGPHNIDRPPFPAPCAEPVKAAQPESEHYKWERGAVV